MTAALVALTLLAAAPAGPAAPQGMTLAAIAAAAEGADFLGERVTIKAMTGRKGGLYYAASTPSVPDVFLVSGIGCTSAAEVCVGVRISRAYPAPFADFEFANRYNYGATYGRMTIIDAAGGRKALLSVNQTLAGGGPATVRAAIAAFGDAARTLQVAQGGR